VTIAVPALRAPRIVAAIAFSPAANSVLAAVAIGLTAPERCAPI
jgi:hypothetical protein